MLAKWLIFIMQSSFSISNYNFFFRSHFEMWTELEQLSTVPVHRMLVPVQKKNACSVISWNTTRQIILFAELCIDFCRVMLWLTRQKIKICRVKRDHSTHWIIILHVVAEKWPFASVTLVLCRIHIHCDNEWKPFDYL